MKRLIFLFFLLIINSKVWAQTPCLISEFSIPACIETGSPIQFTNISVTNTSCQIYWYWEIEDTTGNFIDSDYNTDLNYTFPNSGYYNITLTG